MVKHTFLTLVGAVDGPADGGTEAASRTLIEGAHAQLRDDIIEGLLAPGEKLRVEHLKTHYQVGAGTLREAVTRLVSDALVVAEGQRGFRVAPMTLEDFLDLTQLRLRIELEALRQTIRHGDAAWRARLATRLRRALGNARLTHRRACPRCAAAGRGGRPCSDRVDFMGRDRVSQSSPSLPTSSAMVSGSLSGAGMGIAS